MLQPGNVKVVVHGRNLSPWKAEAGGYQAGGKVLTQGAPLPTEWARGACPAWVRP